MLVKIILIKLVTCETQFELSTNWFFFLKKSCLAFTCLEIICYPKDNSQNSDKPNLGQANF